MKKGKYANAIGKCSSVYDAVGFLVKAKALDFSMAYEAFGFSLPKLWRDTEKAHFGWRKEFNLPTISDQWEWMAIKFEAETARRNS